jgi:hypothetical protein
LHRINRQFLDFRQGHVLRAVKLVGGQFAAGARLLANVSSTIRVQNYSDMAEEVKISTLGNSIERINVVTAKHLPANCRCLAAGPGKP